jgi:hypothetical protein
LAATLKDLGYTVNENGPLEGFQRVYVDDPFGNRIELLEPLITATRVAAFQHEDS